MEKHEFTFPIPVDILENESSDLIAEYVKSKIKDYCKKNKVTHINKLGVSFQEDAKGVFNVTVGFFAVISINTN